MDEYVFRDRIEAGQMLGPALLPLHLHAPVVLGLPRGGVPVAAAVARVLGAPLDVIVVRKLGVPSQHELAMGAIGEDGARVLNDDVIRLARVTPAEIDRVEARERLELDRRLGRLRSVRPREPLSGRTAVLVDDGIATGATMRAAIAVARAHGAARVVVAAPVAPPDVVATMAELADEVVVLEQPEPFDAVGYWYRDFSAVSDDDVAAALTAALIDTDPQITVAVDGGEVVGDLELPAEPIGLVVFAHGSGSSRHSPRNRWVARRLQTAGIATLLMDLLTPEEAEDRHWVFDIDLLADRVCRAVVEVRRRPDCHDLPVGLFGASTGAAAALVAAADPALPIVAVVSRGGRPDLAGDALGEVRAPTLLIVGGEDRVVLELNERAAAQLVADHEVLVVPGATHLFEEPGTLERAADAATNWFLTHFDHRR